MPAGVAAAPRALRRRNSRIQKRGEAIVQEFAAIALSPSCQPPPFIFTPMNEHASLPAHAAHEVMPTGIADRQQCVT